MSIYTDDPVRDFLAHDAEQDAWLKSRPVCAYCGEHIQDEYYFNIGGDEVCPDCLNTNHRMQTEDYEG